MNKPSRDSQGASRTEFENRRISRREIAEALERMADSKRVWLMDFSSGRRKRSDHEIIQKRRELTVLQQAAFDYRAQLQHSGTSAKDASPPTSV